MAPGQEDISTCPRGVSVSNFFLNADPYIPRRTAGRQFYYSHTSLRQAAPYGPTRGGQDVFCQVIDIEPGTRIPVFARPACLIPILSEEPIETRRL